MSLEDLHHLDVEDFGDRRDGFVEKLLQIALGQALLAEPRDRLLLACADAQVRDAAGRAR